MEEAATMKPRRGALLPTALAAALALGAVPASRSHPAPTFNTTVEPTLAVTIDLALEGVERGRTASTGRLRIDLSAVDDVADVDLVIRTPDGLTLDNGAALPHRLAALRRGETRTFALPFSAAREQDLKLRVEATFRTAAGAAGTLGQGITLTASEASPPGRRHLDAYECQAVPLSEWRR
jgi:hypothetical protein